MTGTDIFGEPSPTKRSRNRKEHQARVKLAFPAHPLKPGEQAMWVAPAFDFVGTGDEDEKYGRHWAELHFAKANARKVVSVCFFTGWDVEAVESFVTHQLSEHAMLLCTGLFTHYRYKKDEPDGYATKMDCDLVPSGHCYGEAGSALYGDELARKLVLVGSSAIWDEINKELAS